MAFHSRVIKFITKAKRVANCAGILEQSMEAQEPSRNRVVSGRTVPELEVLNNLRVGIGLSYWPASRLHRPAEFIPWNRFLGSMNV